MIITLDVVDGPERGRTFSFSAADAFLIGRSPRAHLRLDPVADPYISRTHCLLEMRPPRCLLTDLGSTNGTKVNGERVKSAELVNGDLIRVGHTALRLVVSGDDAAAVGAAADPPGAAVGEPTVAVAVADLGRLTVEIDRTVPRLASRPAPAAVWFCDRCGADVSAAAANDGLGHTYQEAVYLCPLCVNEQTDLATSCRTVGAYRIVNEIGRGGMGVVFRAVHAASGRVCAIKQLLPEGARDEAARRMFEREVDVQARVAHPNLVRVWDRARDSDELLYFVTEFMAGGDLERYATKVVGGSVEPRLASRFATQVLAGLAELHERGMIHRDLKPGNFLLTRPAEDPRAVAKISDYGLAKCFEEAGNSIFAYTKAGYVAGSMLFMAPEQITNFRFVRPPADVYSVGVSLYYLLTATYTVDFFGAAGKGKRRHPVEMIIEDPPVPLLDRNSAVPTPLAAVVDRAVQKNPDHRYPTAQAFRQALLEARRQLGWSDPP